MSFVRAAAFCGLAMALCMGACSSTPQPATGGDDNGGGAQPAELRTRAARLHDINEIKRLQARFGDLVSNGSWTEAAELFARAGTIEHGLDGVYRGRERVRAYLVALGGGRQGLAPGRVAERLQIMPVITLAPDGRSARGSWQDILVMGDLGASASWGQGFYENEYVQEDGRWQIARLHWYQTLVVPYEGGWPKHADQNGAKYVSDSLPPDAPPTTTYPLWPKAFVPPFHFKGTAVGAPSPIDTPAAPARRRNETALAEEAAALVARLEDEHEIERLQRTYGYYLDKGLWSQATELFAEDASMVPPGGREVRGRPRILQYLRAIGPEGPAAGRLYDHMQLQPFIEVAKDGLRAQGRWKLFAQLAQAKQFHEWGIGTYVASYVKDAGTWRIERLELRDTLYTPFEEGWGRTQRPLSRFEPQIFPQPADGAPSRPLAAPKPAAEPPLDAAALAALERRLSLLEDAQRLENLHAVYGYYLATLEWDHLANLFAEDGTIEIALRGVYVGRPAVRRNLNLYGQQGLDDGVLHNHMQFQPVITVAPDGRTAHVRSRAFSMMGNFGRNGTWMAGTYENLFEKVNGTWMFKKDQVMNTYFAPYDVGWKELPSREAPGITASNPPDRPPSFHFDLYPKSFLPPFHYPNPVTGRPATWP